MSNLRQKILEARDIQEMKLYIPEWEASVLIRGLSVKERNALLKNSLGENGETDISKMVPELIIRSCYYPENPEKRIFEMTDKEVLSGKSSRAVDRVVAVANELSGLTLNFMEESEKNSEGAGEDSVSTSPESSE